MAERYFIFEFNSSSNIITFSSLLTNLYQYNLILQPELRIQRKLRR